jgi:hypothetical protein
MRRVFFLFFLLLWPSLTWAETQRFHFEMTRKGQKIGVHQVDVTGTDAKQNVTVKILIDVKMGPLTLYKYRHESHEQWRGGVLYSLHSRTVDKGKSYKVDVTTDENGTLTLKNQDGEEYTVPASIIPTSYWNPAITQQTEVLDTQKGLVRTINIAEGSEENYSSRIGNANYRAIPYTMSGDLRLKLWYTLAGEWVGLHFDQKGTTIAYRRAPFEHIDVDF